MRGLNEYIIVDESRQDNLRPTSKKELEKLIKRRIKEQGPNCDLNDIDVSKITDMSYLFEDSNFKGDISKWDVSNVKDMGSMFKYSNFKGNLDKWNVSNIVDKTWIFYRSPLDGREPRWWGSKD